MIPAIFRAEKLKAVNGGGTEAVAAAMAVARRETAAVLGFSSAVGALGGFFIPRALGASITATGGATTAFGAFFVCYIVCVAVTWWFYLRRSFLVGLAPSLAHANA
jgi:NNP family nitrate/nitrite transporter-like MFS transporter